jgi:hypothetical protein
MPYKDKGKRPYKQEYKKQIQRPNDIKTRPKRQQARELLDQKGINRKGKDIDHTKPLSKGGTNAMSNLKLKSPSKNRSFSRNSDHSVKKNKTKK